MRVAYVCADPGVPVFGRKGCSVHVQEMLRALLKQGATVELFAVCQGGEIPADLRGVRVHELSGFGHPTDAHDIQPLNRANSSLGQDLERWRPYDLVYERYSLWSCAGMQFARRAGVPGVLEVNAPLIEEQARYRQLHAPELAQRIAARAFADASVIGAVSSQVAEYVRSFPSTRGRVHVIHNGVDPNRFQRPRGAVTDGQEITAWDDRPTGGEARSRPCTFGFVGSLKPWHGVATLVTAFERVHRSHPDTRLLIVGDGPERANLIAQLEAGNRRTLSAVTMTGSVPPDEVPACLSRMDVAVAPYPALPGFYFSPLKIFEYMAAGLPVVAGRVGDLPGLIRQGCNGLLYSPGDVAELTAAMQQLREDSRLRRRLGDAARATVLDQHTWDHVARQFLSLAGLTCGGRSEVEVRARACPARREPAATSVSATDTIDT